MSTNNTCANCGKGEESSGDLKACTACKMVKYCNRDCQIAHRSQHKKACKKRAAELHDEALFKEPPPPEDCPICMLPPPIYENDTGITFFSCCGKDICSGCIYAMRETGSKNMKLCPFCKACWSPGEEIKRLHLLMDKGNAMACFQLAGHYANGSYGVPQDEAKANEFYLKAGQLGCALAYYNLGCAYDNGDGVATDKKKARHYYEHAAMNGDLQGRHNLGCSEGNAGNLERAYKHFKLAASAGYKPSLDFLKEGFMKGFITKEEYANTLREYQKSREEMKSDARDKALTYLNNIH